MCAMTVQWWSLDGLKKCDLAIKKKIIIKNRKTKQNKTVVAATLA